ncbi:hypothetical protein [Allokutzneria oryzae]|uniref:ADP ribosyltransferase domain-containing protein n=1 Tax=Allokutzneria oryzae TaxID=1378989 RepID=A0ABV6A790_9PSEU
MKTLWRRRSQAPEAPGLGASAVGAALVVHPGGGPSRPTLALAAALPADPERLVVVVEPPRVGDGLFWEALAGVLAGRGPVRLVLPGAAGGANPPARWLADRLGTEVLAPEGRVVTVPGGSVFVAGGRWLRLRPGAPPLPLGSRFPVPRWEIGPVRPSLGQAFVEQIPAGLWLRPQPPGGLTGQVFALPCLPDVLTVVVGDPGRPPVWAEDVRALLTAIPAALRPAVRLAGLGDDGPGQDLADRLGAAVTSWTGLPVASRGGVDVVAVDRDGRPAWRPFATVLRHFPGGGEPKVVRYRSPAAGLVERQPGVFAFADGVVAEVVESGLWVREDSQPGAPQKVRALPLDRQWARVTVAPGLEDAAIALVSRLDPLTRAGVRLVFTDSDGAARHSPVRRDDCPTIVLPAVAVTAAEAVPLPPAPEPVVVRIEPDHRSTQAEREWMRRSLGARYDHYANAVQRLLAERPGLRGAGGGHADAVVADLVAVQVFASAKEQPLDDALRAGDLDKLHPYAACVVSGLRRLPRFRGPVWCGGLADGSPRRVGAECAEPGFVNAVATPAVELPGAEEVVLWSVTGRRAGDLWTDPGAERHRVVFAPGSRFRVLDVVEPADGHPRRVLLRELVATETVAAQEEQDRNALEGLRAEVGRRDAAEDRAALANPASFARAFPVSP